MLFDYSAFAKATAGFSSHPPTQKHYHITSHRKQWFFQSNEKKKKSPNAYILIQLLAGVISLKRHGHERSTMDRLHTNELWGKVMLAVGTEGLRTLCTYNNENIWDILMLDWFLFVDFDWVIEMSHVGMVILSIIQFFLLDFVDQT